MTEKNSEYNRNTNLDNTTDFLTTTITTTTGAQDRSDALSFVLSPEVIVNIVFFLLLSLIIVSANLLVLASVYANSRLQRPTYYMIVSLSAADLIVGLVLLPARLVELLFFEWTKQFVWCKMTSSLNLFSLSASLLNLLAFTLDRFLAIFYALKYRTVMTPNKLLVTIATVWLAAFLASFLPLFGVGTRPENTYRVTRLCRLVDTLDERYMAVYFVFVCAVPTILISVAHIKIFLLARSHERRIASLRVSNERSTKLVRGFRPVILTRDSKAAKTIAIVIGLFYLCWVPFFVGILLSIFKEEIVSYLFIAIVTCVVYSNSAINPLVYGCLDREFRNTYKQLVRGFLHLPRSRRVSQDNTLAATTRNGGRDSMAVTQGKP